MLDHGSLDSSSADPVQALRHRMRHSASHVMADAVLKLFPEAKMGIGPPTQEGFYYDFEVSRPFTPEDLERIDPLVNAIWATSWCIFPDGRTFLDGVTLLEQGCFARFEEDRPLQVGRYWHPRPQHVPWPTLARAREHAEHLRALLLAKLARDLDPTGGNLLTLSGGVDSSSLAALAAGTVGRSVWTWSLLPAREDLLQHELSYIEPLAQRYGFARRWTVLFHERLVLDLWRAAPRIVFYVGSE